MPDRSRAAFGGDLDEDVDGLAQHDASPGHDAVQLRVAPYRQRQRPGDQMREGDVAPMLRRTLSMKARDPAMGMSRIA